MISSKYHDQFQFVSHAPDDRKNLMIRMALAMEQKTLTIRENDDYLCRFGLQEMHDSLLKNGPGTEVPSPPGYFGTTVAVPEGDPSFVPKFLSREEWEPKQAAAREQFPTTLSAIVGQFKVPISGRVAEANLIKKVEPIYPPLAKKARVQGTVEFTAIISKDGHVSSLQLVRGHPLLVDAARDAVSQWQYMITTVNGEPVEVITDIIVNFTLSR